jgi:flagella basal body P-ring formation protein FlgA
VTIPVLTTTKWIQVASRLAVSTREIAALSVALTMFAVSPSFGLAQNRPHSSIDRQPLGSIDATTRWAFRVQSPVTVTSPIVRLGDVVEPLDPKMAGWSRLKRSPIGLLPLTSQPMTIRRDRLERAILDAEATPLAIDWTGPSEISVAYQPQKKAAPSATSEKLSAKERVETSKALVETVSHQTDVAQNADIVAVSPADARRIHQLVLHALERSYPELPQTFRVEFPTDSDLLQALKAMQTITAIEPIDAFDEGECRLQIVGRGPGGTSEAVLRLDLIAHPRVVVTRRMLPKGHRLTLQDLELRPIPEPELSPDHVIDAAELVGQEARVSLRAGRPLSRAEIGPATLVRKGDLVEVRVFGGGVTVTTNAKAFSEGAEFDLIEVETTDPRKRLLARVVQSGLVEVVTRVHRAEP